MTFMIAMTQVKNRRKGMRNKTDIESVSGRNEHGVHGVRLMDIKNITMRREMVELISGMQLMNEV